MNPLPIVPILLGQTPPGRARSSLFYAGVVGTAVFALWAVIPAPAAKRSYLIARSQRWIFVSSRT